MTAMMLPEPATGKTAHAFICRYWMKQNGSYCYALAIAEGDVYIGGYCKNSAGDSPVLKNGVWDNIRPFLMIRGLRWSLHWKYRERNLYAGGMSTEYLGDGTSRLLEERNSVRPLPKLDPVRPAMVNSIVICGSNVYAAGYCRKMFVMIESPAIGKMRNGPGLPVYFDETRDATRLMNLPYQERISFAAGYCRNSSNVSVPGYWKNEEWIGLPPADSTKISDAKAIVVGWK